MEQVEKHPVLSSFSLGTGNQMWVQRVIAEPGPERPKKSHWEAEANKHGRVIWREQYKIQQVMPGTNAVAGMVDDNLSKFVPLDGFEEDFPQRPSRSRMKYLTDCIRRGNFYSQIIIPRMSTLHDWMEYIARNGQMDTRQRQLPMKLWRTPKQAAEGWCVEVFDTQMFDIVTSRRLGSHFSINGMSDAEMQLEIELGNLRFYESGDGVTISYQADGGQARVKIKPEHRAHHVPYPRKKR